jgi:hypothetical protein
MQALPAGSAAAAAAVLPPAGAAASPAASPVRDRSLDDDDDNTHSGSKRRRRPAAQEINQSGLALASNGQALLIQPHAVWQAYAKANPDMTTNRPTAFERYELCGLFQALPWNSAELPLKMPQFWCNACQQIIALSVKTGTTIVQFSTLMRHLRLKHARYLLLRDVEKGSDPFTMAAAAAQRKTEDATEEIPGVTSGAGEPSSSVFNDDKALKALLTTLAASGYLADGEPANTISHIGERFKLQSLAKLLKSDYAAGLPSWYLIDKEMVALARSHLEILKKSIATMHVHEFITARYSLIADKWDDDYGNDILGVVIRFLDK